MRPAPGELTRTAPPITQYWDAEAVPDYVEDLFSTYREHNPDMSHLVFSEADAERLIADRFGPREVAAFQACAVAAMQSDYFRYCAVLALGGVYADADTRCLAPLGPLVEGLDGGQLFCRPDLYPIDGERMHRVLNGFFAFREPGHPLLRLTLEIATANLEERIAERAWAVGQHVREAIWLTVGPGVFTLLYYLHRLGSFDRFHRAGTGTPAEPFMGLFLEVVGDYDRVVEAFEGVRVSSFESMWSWIGETPEESLPYKQTDAHWKNVKTSIFR